jgi:predicted dithiol-disulfide oxidoreductase (DUF899 family)
MGTMEKPAMGHAVVSREEWLEARESLLAREKAFSRERDELSRQRRELPWEKVDKEYVFDGREGRKTLGDLFEGRSQLIVYHFMFGPEWEDGCKSCSFLSDHFDGSIAHLNARDVSFVAISRAPLARIEAFRKRMGWRFPWVSSFATDFNFDFHVSFTDEEMEKGEVSYNYTKGDFGSSEAPGVSVFARDVAGGIFHTYSAYSRGLDILIGAYNFLDLVPKGRDEDDFPYGMAWVRHHDRYDEP